MKPKRQEGMMSDDELTEEDLAAGMRALADSAERTAMETRAIGQRLGILPPDENPRPQTVGAALAAFDGSQRALQAALGELIEARDEAAVLAARVEAQERDIERLTAALSKAAQDAIALETQLLAAQKANTALIERVVDLEHARDRAMLVVACAVSLISRAEGLAAQLHGLVSDYITEAEVRALSLALAPYRGGDAPPRAVTPGHLCDHCGLPLVSSHIADEVRLELAGRHISAHRGCADYLSSREGWQRVAKGGS